MTPKRIVQHCEAPEECGSFMPDERSFSLSEKDEASLLESLAEADRGELIDAKDVLRRL